MTGAENGATAGGRRVAGSTNRLLLLVADGCRVCVGLDAVAGVFDLVPAEQGTAATLPDGSRVPLLDWSAVAGVGPSTSDKPAKSVMVVRTPGGPLGLAAESCLGVREAELDAAPLFGTRLADVSGKPLCFVQLVDRKPHFILDPRALALVAAAGRRA